MLLENVFQREDVTFIRYVVRNGCKESHGVSTPQAYKVHGSPKALKGLSNTQLTDNAVAHLKFTGNSPVEVTDSKVRSPRVEALGKQGNGHATDASGAKQSSASHSELMKQLNNLQQQLYAEREKNKRLKGG